MKERHYTSLAGMFCPNCRQRIVSPIRGAAGQTPRIVGTFRVECSRCHRGVAVVTMAAPAPEAPDPAPAPVLTE